MLLHINGWAGVGKLTVARILAARLGARVLDNHSLYNVAFALTEFRTPAFYETVRAVRGVAFDRAADLDPAVPVLLTNALGESSEWARENWTEVRRLAERRGCPLVAVTLRCSREEHLMRATNPERLYLGKLTDRPKLEAMLERDLLAPTGADRSLDLDTTGAAPEVSAGHVLNWLGIPES